ncbi:hypothetical protein ACFQZ4_19970 [Catellatospora coxensis]
MSTEVVDADRVALRLHAAIEEALVSAQFLNLTELTTSISTDRLAFQYRDPDYEFDLTFLGDGTVVLERRGSRMRAFHDWYTSFMPYVPQILRRAMAAFDTELHHRLMPPHPTPADTVNAMGTDVPERVKLLSSSFNFEVVCHRLAHEDSAKISTNLEVMRDNVAVRLPDAGGVMTRQEEPHVADYGRMDYRIGLRHPKRNYVTQFLTVMAPSNAKWSGLFFTFAYVGENSTDWGEGHRVAINPRFFLSPEACADAYISFFLDIGLVGFVASVTKGYTFTTTASTLD